MEALRHILTNPELGSAASIIGLVSLVGFAVTFYNVIRSKRAAEEARNAVLRVQRDISRIDAVADYFGVNIDIVWQTPRPPKSN